MNHTRATYQHGSLSIEKRKNGPDLHVIRWREAGPNGTKVRRKAVVGTVVELPTKAAVRKAVESHRLEINNGPASAALMSVADVVTHYDKTELASPDRRTARTQEVYRQHLRMCIVPRWGNRPISSIRAIEVEEWLQQQPGAPATKSKTKNVFSGVFQHAHRHGWVLTNPMRSVRQSNKAIKEVEILTAAEITLLLQELADPFRLVVHIAATTGMRRGEIFGLKWEDLDFERAEVRIVRSIVDQVAGEPKTTGSKRPLPLPAPLVEALGLWRTKALFAASDDWVFASPHCLGRQPYWPNTVLERQVRPAALRAGIRKRFGWHTFRHTFATMLQRAVLDPKVTQSLLRHASPVMTLGRYAHAVTEDKRNAQELVSSQFAINTDAAAGA